MNRRAVLFVAAVVLVLPAVVWGVVYAVRQLLARPPHELVLTFRRQSSIFENDTQIGAEASRTLFAKSPRVKAVRSEATGEGVRVTASFDSKQSQFPDDRKVAAAAGDQVLHTLSTVIDPPAIDEAEGASYAWVLGAKDLHDELDAIRGVTVSRACGVTRPDRVRVKLDAARLATKSVDPFEAVRAVLRQEHAAEAAGQTLDAAAALAVVVHGNVRLGDIGRALPEPRPPVCAALGPDGKGLIAHRVSLHPKTSSADRARVDAVVKDATMLAEKDYLEARFLVPASLARTSTQTIAADIALRAKAKSLPLLAVTVADDGQGRLIFKRDEKILPDVRTLVQATEDASWAGVHGARYVQVTIRDLDRNAAEGRSVPLAKKISSIENIGPAIATRSKSRLSRVFVVNEQAAVQDNVDLDAIRALAPAAENVDADVVFDITAVDTIRIQGKPFSTYATVRTTTAPPRLLRIDGLPAVELRWEVSDSKTANRVAHAVADVSGVTFEDVSSAP